MISNVRNSGLGRNRLGQGFGAAAQGGFGQGPDGATSVEGNDNDLELNRQSIEHGTAGSLANLLREKK